MSDPTHTPALEELERTVRSLARGSTGIPDSWNSLRQQVDLLKSGLPPLDPEEARRFNAELKALIAVLSGEKPADSSHGPEALTRIGYLIEGTPGHSDAKVRPAFAEALRVHPLSPDLAQTFPDLWAVDANLARRLVVDPFPSNQEIALAWLESPGRLLSQDLSILERCAEPARIGEERKIGAVDLSIAGLDAAAGSHVDLRDAWSPPWREWHAALPGTPAFDWEPAEGPDAVFGALQILEGRRGDPLFLRGAALGWLLNRAAQAPRYEFGGIKRNLPDDLALSIYAGFPDPSEPQRHALLQATARLEIACLQHAALLTAEDTSAKRAVRTWHIARWIHSTTFRSPFVGGDDEALSARLNALLPVQRAPRGDDVLDPALIGDDKSELSLADLTLVSGAVQHYGREGGPRLLPTPAPLLSALRRLANRRLREGERAAEARWARCQTSEDVHNSLGWEGSHLAPPLVARWLLSILRAGWLTTIHDAVLDESLELFQQEPARYFWIALALYSEGALLRSPLRERAAQALRQVLTGPENSSIPPASEWLGIAGPLHLGAGVLDQLEDDEVPRLITLARQARPDWRYRALEGLAESAERLQRDETWRLALDGLLEFLPQTEIDPQERIRAALVAVRRILARPPSHPDRGAYLERLGALAARPPFDQVVALRRDLRRGLSSLAGPRQP